MSDSRSRKGHGRPVLTRNYQTIALIDLSALPQEACRRFAEELDKTVYEASADHPTATRYFVELDDQNVTVGLHLENVEPQNVENIAAAIIDESLDSLTQQFGLTTRVEVEESELYLV